MKIKLEFGNYIHVSRKSHWQVMYDFEVHSHYNLSEQLIICYFTFNKSYITIQPMASNERLKFIVILSWKSGVKLRNVSKDRGYP